MIRKAILRWQDRHYGEQTRFLRAVCNTNPDTWRSRYYDWNISRYGEERGNEPIWLRPVSRFVCWVDDWAIVWSGFKPHPGERR